MSGSKYSFVIKHTVCEWSSDRESGRRPSFLHRRCWSVLLLWLAEWPIFAPFETKFFHSCHFHILYIFLTCTYMSWATEEDVVNRMPKFLFIRILWLFEIGQIRTRPPNSFFLHFLLLWFSLPSCCPICFKLCLPLLLIITSGPFFITFSRIFKYFSEEKVRFLWFFGFGTYLLSDSVEILLTPSTYHFVGCLFSVFPQIFRQ